MQPASLSSEEVAGKAERISPVFVTAIPESFADDAISKIEALVAQLLESKARRFEIVFSNRVSGDNLWGDKVLLGMREKHSASVEILSGVREAAGVDA